MIVHSMRLSLAVDLLEAKRQSDENEERLNRGEGGWDPAVRWRTESGELLVIQWYEIPCTPGATSPREVGIGKGIKLGELDVFTAPPWVQAVVLYNDVLPGTVGWESATIYPTPVKLNRRLRLTLEIETKLTVEQIEESLVRVLCCDVNADEQERRHALIHNARVLRVLPVDVEAVPGIGDPRWKGTF